MKGIISILAGICFAALIVRASRAQMVPTTTPASTQPVSLPDEIGKALRHEADGLWPTVTVGWTERHEPPWTAAEYAKGTGRKKFDHHRTFTEEDEFDLTWQSDGRYLVAFRWFFKPSGSDNRILNFNTRYSFDRTTFYELNTNPGETHALTRADYENAPTVDYYLDYFSFIGFPLPASAAELEKRMALQASILLLLDDQDTRLTSVDSALVDGHRLTRLKFERGPGSEQVGGDEKNLDSYEGTDYFYLDPARGYAQLRRERFDAQGKLIARTDCSNFNEFPERGIFLPQTIVKMMPQSGNEPPVKISLTVRRIDFAAVPVEKFILSESTPGTWFVDNFGDKSQTRILQKNGSFKPKK